MNRRLYLIAFGFIDIATGLVVILSVGSFYPNWQLRFAAWYALRDIQKRKVSDQK